CEERLSTMHPAGPAAEAIATMWWVLLVGATAISLFVLVLLVLAFRRRNRAVAPEESRHERFWIHGLGLGFTITILAALTSYGIYIGERLLPRPGPEVVTVRAEGAQWVWRFTYADAPGQMTENVLHIPAGRPVDVEITSGDVVHSFWAPRLAGKL